MKKIFLSFLLISIAVFWSSGFAQETDFPSGKFDVNKDSVYIPFEFRGAWLSTVESIDWPKVKIYLDRKIKPDGSMESSFESNRRIQMQRDSQKTALVSLITSLKRAGCNAVMFQVVSNTDALYPSKILQWAPSLTDTPGASPGYDPLALAVKTAHSLGMDIHAWINPLRIGKVELPRREDNICYVNSKYVQEHKGRLYWDPGQEWVRQYLASLATELMQNYELDGLHIDDYFYPSGLKNNKDQAKNGEKIWNDEALFAEFGKGKTLDEWRESNIDEIVRVMHEAVHKVNPNAVFGVSPAGRLVNTQGLYADPRNWAKQGTIDYLIPQIYWQHGHAIADFKTVLDSWAGILGDTPVIVGLAAYRYKSKEFPEFSEYEKQVFECRQAPSLPEPQRQNVVGECWFTTHDIITDEFTGKMLNSFYSEEVLPPFLGKDPAPLSSPDIFKMGKHIRWSEIPGADSFVVYKLEKTKEKTAEGGVVWKANLLKKLRGFIYKCDEGGNYIVLACKKNRYSQRSNVLYIK